MISIYIDATKYCKATLIEGYILHDMIAVLNADSSTINDLAERLQVSQALGKFTIKQHIEGGNYCLMLDGLYFDTETARGCNTGYSQCEALDIDRLTDF